MHHKASFLLFPSIFSELRRYSCSGLRSFLSREFFIWTGVTIKVLRSFITQLKMMIRFSVAHSAAGEGQLSQQEPLKGFTRFSFYSWQMDQKILRNHWDPFQAFFAIKKSVWRDLQNCCVLYRQSLLKRASKTKLSKYLSILMNGTAQNDSWNAWKVFHFKVFCHKKKLKSRSDWGILMCLLRLI